MIQNDKIININFKVLSVCEYDNYKYKYSKIDSFDTSLFTTIENVNITIKEQLRLLISGEIKND